jgi:uncharacterized short protein YbdD (DUF466 family)
MPDRRRDGGTEGRRDITSSPERHLSARLFGALRQIVGMPDYTAYTKHLRRCHPQLPIPSEKRFYEEFVNARYGDGPTRCC